MEKIRCPHIIIGASISQLPNNTIHEKEIVRRQSMDFEVIISYLPLYKDALLLTLRIGWQGVLIAFVLGLLCALIMHLKIPGL